MCKITNQWNVYILQSKMHIVYFWENYQIKAITKFIPSLFAQTVKTNQRRQ